jgi:Copper transport outer membrane protein, MctB
MGGYSARYHAASLAAVFLALAIGILIGVGFGDDVVSGTTEDLEESLQNDVERARDRTDELSRELNRERAFGDAVYPALVGGDLRGERVGLVALGALSDEIADEVDAAIEPAGAKLAQVAVVREPPDLAALADELRDTPYSRLRRDPDDLFDFAQAAGRGLVRGDGIVRRVRAQLLSRFSGRARAVDAVVVTRDAPQDLEPDDADANETFEDGLLDGIADAGRPLVGVERTDAERSSIELFSSHDISTVDDVDLVAGRVALISVLLGAEGSFGVKDTADELLPDLIRPAVGSR